MHMSTHEEALVAYVYKKTRGCPSAELIIEAIVDMIDKYYMSIFWMVHKHPELLNDSGTAAAYKVVNHITEIAKGDRTYEY
jgi:hypothetical protein